MNAEALQPDGTFLPGDGTLTRFQPPAGHGVRVDTAAYPGYPVGPRYDSLLAKVICRRAARWRRRPAGRSGRWPSSTSPACRPTRPCSRRCCGVPALGTLDAGYLDAHAAELAADGW